MQTDIRPTVLSPVTTTQVSNKSPIIIAGVVDTGDKIIAGVMESMKIRGQGVFTVINDARQ